MRRKPIGKIESTSKKGKFKGKIYGKILLTDDAFYGEISIFFNDISYMRIEEQFSLIKDLEFKIKRYIDEFHPSIPAFVKKLPSTWDWILKIQAPIEEMDSLVKKINQYKNRYLKMRIGKVDWKSMKRHLIASKL